MVSGQRHPSPHSHTEGSSLAPSLLSLLARHDIGHVDLGTQALHAPTVTVLTAPPLPPHRYVDNQADLSRNAALVKEQAAVISELEARLREVGA